MFDFIVAIRMPFDPSIMALIAVHPLLFDKRILDMAIHFKSHVVAQGLF